MSMLIEQSRMSLNLLEQRRESAMTESRSISATMLEFVRDNVFSITELTRTNKLAEILDSFGNKKSNSIYIVKNGRNKDSQGALVDVEMLMELLVYRDAVEAAIDHIVDRAAIQRLSTFNPNISLAQIILENELDVEEIMRLSEELEIE